MSELASHDLSVARSTPRGPSREEVEFGVDLARRALAGEFRADVSSFPRNGSVCEVVLGRSSRSLVPDLDLRDVTLLQ